MSSVNSRTDGLSSGVYNTLKSLQDKRKGESLTEKDVDKLVDAMAKDGKIDEAEVDLLDELTANSNEVTVNKEHGTKPVGINFSGISAEKRAGLKDQALEKAVGIARVSSLTRRARDDRGVSETDDLKRILTTDQRLAGENADGSKTKYGVKGDASRNILLQDAILLESKGFFDGRGPLKAEDKTFLAEMVQKRDKNQPLTQDDLRRLDQMVEKVLEYLDADPYETPDMMQSDQGSLALLGDEAGGSVDEQYATVETNLDALLVEADAATHDVSVSTREYGLTGEDIKEQGGKAVEGGRSFMRMAESIEEVDRQFALIKDDILPAIDKKIASLDAQMDQRMMELTGTSSIEDAVKALEADPKLKDKVKTDPQFKELSGQREQAVLNSRTLHTKLEQLGEARVVGLKRLKEVRVIESDRQERMGAIGVMGGKLGQGMESLSRLKAHMDTSTRHANHMAKEAGKIGDAPLEGTTDGERLADAGVKKTQLDEQQELLDGDKRNMEIFREEALEVCDQMIEGMDTLIAAYKATDTHNPEVLKLLEAEKASLEATKTSIKNNSDPTEAIGKLIEKRNSILKTLGKLVPSHLDSREFKALAGLDKQVSQATAKGEEFRQSYDKGVKAYNEGSSVIGSAKDLLTASEDELKAAIKRAEEGKDSVIEEATALWDTNSTEETGKKGKYHYHAALSYGSHARIYLGLGVGLKGDIGILEGKISVGVEGSLTLEKSFGSGPSYLLHVDIAAKLHGEVTLDLLVTEFKGSFDLKAGLTAGLAFSTAEEAKAFGSELVRFAGLCMALKDAGDKDEIMRLKSELQDSMGKLEKMITDHKYDGHFVEAKAELEEEGGGTEVGIGMAGGFQENSYADGSVIKDTKLKGEVKLGHYKLEVFHEKSEVLTQPTSGPPIGDSSRTVVELKIPASVLKEIITHGMNGLSKEAISQIFKIMSANNPGLAAMGVEKMLGLLDKALPSDRKGLSRLMATANRLEQAQHAKGHGHGGGHHKGPVKAEAGISVGISFGTKSDGAHFVAVEFNLEASVDVHQEFGNPAGGAYAYVEGGASVKVGREFELSWHGDAH